jgi:hypothetical protein
MFKIDNIWCMFGVRRKTNKHANKVGWYLHEYGDTIVIGKRHFGLKPSKKNNEESRDMILKENAIASIFNIGDFVPLLKPFDL